MRGRRGRRSGRGRHLFEFVRAFITDRKSFSSWMILEGGDMIRNVTFVEWRERSLRFRHRFHFELPRVTRSCKVARMSRDLLIRLNFICGRKGEAYPSVSLSPSFLKNLSPRQFPDDTALVLRRSSSYSSLSLSLRAKELLPLRSALDLLLSLSKRLTHCIYCGQFLGKRLSTG